MEKAESFHQFHPDASFKMIEAEDERAGLVFTEDCLGGWGTDRWTVARNLGLYEKDICAYCREYFRLWTQLLGLRADIVPKKDGN